MENHFTQSHETITREMIGSLNEEEIEIAARSSYRYLKLATKNKKDGPPSSPSSEIRNQMAMKMARRHLIASNGVKEKALQSLQSTIQYRKTVSIDAIRCCYENPNDTDIEYEKLRHLFDKQMEHPSIFVGGYDKENRAILMIDVGQKTDFHPVNFILMHVLVIERAFACTERVTDGKQEKVTVFINYNGFSERSSSPPLQVTKELLYCLRDHFPERVDKIFLMDAPLVFRGIWKIIRLFVDPITKQKIHFVTGEKQKRVICSKVVDPEQARPFMHPEGKRTERVDMKRFLYDTPFDRAYGEV